MKYALVVILLLGLTGCGMTVNDVKKDGEFARLCHSQGGKVYYGDGGIIRCDFTDR